MNNEKKYIPSGPNDACLGQNRVGEGKKHPPTSHDDSWVVGVACGAESKPTNESF